MYKFNTKDVNVVCVIVCVCVFVTCAEPPNNLANPYSNDLQISPAVAPAFLEMTAVSCVA